MTIGDILKESWISISGNKLSSFLTVLGIIIGVMAVVIMVAVGETVQKSITDQLSSLGTNTIVIRAGAARTGGVRMGNRQTLTITDGDQIKRLSDELDRLWEISKEIIRKNTTMSDELLSEIYKTDCDYIMNSEQALSLGIIDEII